MSIDCAWDVLKSVVAVIKRPIGYVMSAKNNADGLQKKVGELAKEAERVHILEIGARNNLRSFHGAFTEWQASAEKASKEARNLLDAFEKATKTCCYGTLPDPYCRYQFSRKAEAEIEVIRQLAQKCSEFEELNDISFINPAPGSVTAPTPARIEGKDAVQSTTSTASASSTSTLIKLRDDGIFESRAQIIQDIKDALADNSNSVVAIYGMGGLGKSTLLEEVKRIISKEKSFDWVAKADVSKNPDIKNIQGEIADALGLSDIKNKESVSGRAELLHGRLEEEERNKKKVLIILDNLWKGLDLKSVGIPCRYDNKVIGCKLLLTSRDQNVLRREMGCDRDFLLGGLQKEEAKRLFERMVGDKVHDDEFKPWVDVALDKSAGVPFLIVAMAKRFKNANLSEWKDTLRKIKKFKDEEINDLIHQMLQWSYEKLDEEVKSLLRLCVVYGISEPSLENLVRYGFGLGLFREVNSMEDARDSLSTHICTLQASSLLLDSEDVDGFKIHDLVHDFIAAVSLRDHPLFVLKDEDESLKELLKDKPRKYMAICFPYVDMEELPQELDCAELRIFLLFTNNESLHVADSLFNSMRKLMVLNFTGVDLTRSPLPFQLLENLLTLCLDGCSLEDVSILGKLKGLQVLSFVNSKIQRLPKEIGQLVELRLLDLNNCRKLQIIEPGVLGSLIKLEELYMENSFDQWSAEELPTPPTNASLVELNNMKKLCTLYVFIPDLSVLPKDLNVEKLTKYGIRIGNAWRWSNYKGSRTLELKLNPMSDILQKECIQSISGKTDDLFLDGLDGIGQSIYALSQEGFSTLKHLQVENSSSVHYIHQSSSHEDFKRLESLILQDLINLEKLCHNHIYSKSFSALKVVRVRRCHKMQVLFPLPLLRELPCLEEIKVIDCKLMQGIGEADDCGNVKLLNLHVLKLRDLPCINNFFKAGSAPSSSTSDDQVGTQNAFFSGQQVSIPCLESLTIKGLPNLKEIWSNNSPLELSNLQSLIVMECKSLSKVISSRSLVNLHKLHSLSISNCNSVQEIFYLDGLSAIGDVEILSELTTLELNELGSLRRIWNKNPYGIVSFHNLKKLVVYGCPNLRFMFFPSMVTSLAQLKDVMVRRCKKMEAIIMEEEGLGLETSETLAFPMLTYLSLTYLESLKCFSLGKCSQEARSQDHVKEHSAALFSREVVFPRLETLRITGLDNIVMIWDDQVAADSFPKLKSLCVGECNRLVHIVTSSILGQILSLESLKARSCGLLKVVFKFQPLNPLDGHPIARSPLKELELFDLPELKCVWDKELHPQVKFQCLRSVSVDKCESLTSLFPASIARDLMQFEELKIRRCGIVELIEKERSEELSINVEAIEGASHELSYFRHLKTLDVSYCGGLSYMFTPTMAINLMALTELRISNCRMFTEVISDEGGRDGHVAAFNQLKYIELKGLTRLRCFSSGGFTLMFPLLEDVTVTRCLNMNFFSKGPIETPKLKRVQVSRDAAAAWFWKEDLNITIQNMFEEMGTFAGVKKMLLSELPDLIGKWHRELNPIKSSWQLESLTVDKCPSFIKAIPSKLMLVLDNLSSLQVYDCKSLEEIFDLEGLEAMESTQVLPQLQELNLVNLPKLRQLWKKDLQGSLCFYSLWSLTLYNCSNLGQAFTPSMARCLVCLQQIKIKECGQMDGVIADEEGQGSAVEKITFPNLSTLKLECLSNLTSFLLGKNHTLECPELIELTIAHCPKMRSLTWQSLMEIDHGTLSLFTPQVQFPQLESMVLSHMDNLSKIWTDGPQETLTFDYLRKVEAQNCKSLENLFPHWVATSLTQLKELRVECCGIEEIIASGDDTLHSNTAHVLFPKLTSLVLHDMSRLKSFYPNLPNLNWPFLKELRVTHCDKLNILSFAASMNKWTKRDDQQDLSNQEAHSLIERDFPNLKRLLLVDKDVQMIQDGKFPDDIFGKTKALTLACFHDEKALFPIGFFLERFQNLQSLEVFCSSFEDIFPDEGLVNERNHPVIENLRELKLSKLHNLKHIWREDCSMVKILRSIETFEVWDCPCLTTIFPAAISFQNLTKLVVKNSSGLVHLVTASAIRNLVHLIFMTIIGCERMKEVVANDNNGKGNVISLGKLKWLTFQNLPSLECFSSATSCIFWFPSLWKIEVEECPQMKIFFKGALSTPKLKYGSLFGYKWEWNWEEERDLNTTIQKLSA